MLLTKRPARVVPGLEGAVDGVFVVDVAL